MTTSTFPQHLLRRLAPGPLARVMRAGVDPTVWSFRSARWYAAPRTTPQQGGQPH